ncbi:uncharacterized protein EDB91DRAFT_1126933 [Suillus paluster]|uniref:uncharacterized protein n=1 Tax=Suillus paluster TaxID=48578 RepID=UPI001B8828EE|nr:uncharacterized protein EDB91DRAFT_1126933 [Suillus paluster]KAG1743342.1 hypothetical protein EDB91DRAFT_1126933 [Suillus paluster]
MMCYPSVGLLMVVANILQGATLFHMFLPKSSLSIFELGLFWCSMRRPLPHIVLDTHGETVIGSLRAGSGTIQLGF